MREHKNNDNIDKFYLFQKHFEFKFKELNSNPYFSILSLAKFKKRNKNNKLKSEASARHFLKIF